MKTTKISPCFTVTFLLQINMNFYPSSKFQETPSRITATPPDTLQWILSLMDSTGLSHFHWSCRHPGAKKKTGEVGRSNGKSPFFITKSSHIIYNYVARVKWLESHEGITEVIIHLWLLIFLGEPPSTTISHWNFHHAWQILQGVFITSDLRLTGISKTSLEDLCSCYSCTNDPVGLYQ